MLGGSPCTDLSLVNPARRGLYGESGPVTWCSPCTDLSLVNPARRGLYGESGDVSVEMPVGVPFVLPGVE